MKKVIYVLLIVLILAGSYLIYEKRTSANQREKLAQCLDASRQSYLDKSKSPDIDKTEIYRAHKITTDKCYELYPDATKDMEKQNIQECLEDGILSTSDCYNYSKPL